MVTMQIGSVGSIFFSSPSGYPPTTHTAEPHATEAHTSKHHIAESHTHDHSHTRILALNFNADFIGETPH